jgi:hypothetical protein
MDLLSGLRLLGEGVERLENYVHVELSEVTCCLTKWFASESQGKSITGQPRGCHSGLFLGIFNT